MAFLSSNMLIRPSAKAEKLGIDLTKSDLMSTTTAASGKKSSGSSKKKKSESSAPAAPAAPAYTNEELLAGYTDLFYGAYKPEKIGYTARTADELSKEISAWLRPAYDAAIAARQLATDTYRAELDADAIARGMGASSYVTDVKSRHLAQEADDIAAYETDYAAALAKQMSQAMETDRQRAFETEMFNAEADNEAYAKAYDMALRMLEAYRAGDGGARALTSAMFVSGASSGGSSSNGSSSNGSSSGGSASKGSASGSSVTAAGAVGATSLENCEAFLSGMSAEQRKNIYSGSTAENAAYRAELIASVGAAGYIELMQRYPSR